MHWYCHLEHWCWQRSDKAQTCVSSGNPGNSQLMFCAIFTALPLPCKNTGCGSEMTRHGLGSFKLLSHHCRNCVRNSMCPGNAMSEHWHWQRNDSAHFMVPFTRCFKGGRLPTWTPRREDDHTTQPSLEKLR